MKHPSHKYLFLALLLVGLAAMPSLRAQSASSATTTAIAPAALTDESLRQMLTDLGYAPRKLSKGYLIAPKREGNWTMNMQLVLSPNKTELGLNANLGLVDEATVTASQWAELMVANGDIDPMFFYFDRELKKLFMHRVLDNREITPEYLRAQIEHFADNVKKTEKLWSFTK